MILSTGCSRTRIQLEADAYLFGRRIAVQIIAHGGAMQAVGAQPLLQVVDRLLQLRFIERRTQFELGGRQKLVAIGRIGDALKGNAAHKVVQLRRNAQCHAVAQGLRVNADVGKAPGIEQLLQGLADVALVQRAAHAQRQEAVQFFTGKRLLGRVEIDPLDAAAFQYLRILTRRRYGAEQQQQKHQHRRTHVPK
jgi:hypothetical protein